MNDFPVTEADIARMKQWPHYTYMGNDLLLADAVGPNCIPTEPRRMKCILIGMCTSGNAQYRIDTQTQHVSAGNAIVLTELHIVDQFECSPDFSCQCIVIDPEFFHEIIRNAGESSAFILFASTNPVLSLNAERQAAFHEYFMLLKNKMVATANAHRKQLVGMLIMAMFYDFSPLIYGLTEVDGKQPTRAFSIFTNFIHLVEGNSLHERRVGWYAQQLCITPKYLSETIKSVSMRTPNEWIDRYVTKEARVLLKNTTKSIKEISMLLHFPNQSLFGKFFKENTGFSPREYRKS